MKKFWENFQKNISKSKFKKRIKQIIYQDQVGFSPGMQGWFNTQKSIKVTCYNRLKRKRKNHMITLADAEEKKKHLIKIKYSLVIKTV